MLPSENAPNLDSTAPGVSQIDRAHRIYLNSLSKPRIMIFRLLRYTDRQAIREGVRKAKPTLPDGTHLQFFADYGPRTMQDTRKFVLSYGRKGSALFLFIQLS